MTLGTQKKNTYNLD